MNKPVKKALVPALRFPEFRDAGEWENKKFEDIADFYKGKGISKADIDSQGKTPCIRYGELYTRYNEVINSVFSKTNIPVSGLFLSEINDVLIPSSGETKLDIATASCVLLRGVALGGDLNVIRSDENGVFISYYLNGAKKREISKIAQGDTVVHLYSSQLKLLNLLLPKKPEEQQKIADCLSSLDALITAHTQKHEALKAHKKGLMQQLFPAEGETVPTLRFPEFRDAGEWVIKPLNSLLTIGNGKDYKHLSSGDVPVYGSGGYMLSVDKHLYDGESVCIGRKGTINNPMFLSGKFWTVDTLFYTHSFKDCLPKFAYLIFQNINWLNHNEAGGVPSLSKTNINAIEVATPSLIEQKKITECIFSIDNLITAQSQKIETLKTHKKGLMQQLFPAIDDDCMDAGSRATPDAKAEAGA